MDLEIRPKPEPKKFMFCQKPHFDHPKIDRNQFVDIRICQNGCGHYTNGECLCPPSIQYIAAIRKFRAGELDDIRKQRKAGKRIVVEETEEENGNMET